MSDHTRSDSSIEGSTYAGTLDSTPAMLGGVRLDRLLGEGGMGRVYLGHHPILDVAVAVKVMASRSGDHARFLTEARLAARVQHDNVVRILHAGDEDGCRFLILEYVPGLTLKELIASRGRLPWGEAAGYLLQAARGLAAAHRLGIIHRDIKPSNLLLNANGKLKVADLGLARALLDSSSRVENVVDSVVGTPAYMAPEQAFHPHRVTAAVDVYGLGACFYVMLTGEVPYPGASFRDLLLLHRQKVVPDPRALVPDLPDAVRALALRLLAKDPAGRPADGSAVARELERLLGLATASTTVASPPAARRSLRQWWIATAAGLATIGTVLLGWTHGGDGGSAPAAVVPAMAVPVPPPVAPALVIATPARAVFTLTGTLPAAAQAGLAEACQASGLPVVERARIDALVAEQRLLNDGRLDPASAVQLGHLVGGHLALFAEPVEDRIEVRCVLVETGEVVLSRLVAPDQVRAAAEAGIAVAIALLPVRATVERQADGVTTRAGTRQGLRVGDRLALRRDPTGADVANATVTAITANRASLAVAPADADLNGTLAVRLAP